MDYASNGKANLAVTLGGIGTGLGAIASAGGLANILGVGGNRQPPDPDDRPVTRYEMSLWQQINAEKTENAVLRGQKYTDAAVAGVQAEIGQQAVWNATQQGVINCIRGQVAQLQSMTQLMIPNRNISPGWGPAVVEATSETAAASSGT